MMKKVFSARPAFAVLALALLAGCRGGGSSEILATVANDPITIDQFNNYLGVKSTVRVIVQGQVVELPVSDTLAFQAMQDLVSRSVLMKMAKDEGVFPSDKDISAEIEFQKKFDPNFLPNYQRRGMNVAQIREEVKFSLVQERLITKGITVSTDEVDAWLKNNPRAFIVPASVEMLWIQANTENRKTQVNDALKAGQKFGEVAIKLSQAPSAALMGGKYLPERGPLPLEALTENLRAAVTAAAEGQSTDWIKFPDGWAKFYVSKKTPESTLPLTEERKINVQRNLALQRGNKANDLRKRLVDQIRTTEIVVRRDSLKEAWGNFSKLLQKQAEQQQSQPIGAPAGNGNAPAGSTAVPGK